MTHTTAIQVYVGPEDYGCSTRFDELFTDRAVAEECVSFLKKHYADEDILVREVPVHATVPRFFVYAASIPFEAPHEIHIRSIPPTRRGRWFQLPLEAGDNRIACARGYGATEEEAVADACSIYELACVRGHVAARRDFLRRNALHPTLVLERARALGKVTRDAITREEVVDPDVYYKLCDEVSRELRLY